MIKIVFEVSEDFIRENSSPETAAAKVKTGGDKYITKALVDMINLNLLKKQIDEGKTEFVVTPDKLNGDQKRLFNNTIGEICLLAVLSEADNKKEESEE